MSLWDTVRLQLRVTVPSAVAGLVVPYRRAFRWLARRGTDGRAMRFLHEIREKYGDHVWTWFPLRRTLIVFALPTVERVLQSSDNAADPTLKRRALSRFAPDSLVISSGDEWLERRAFNECALDLERPLRLRDTLAELAADEAARLIDPPRTLLRWRDFETLGWRLSHQVAFGKTNIDAGLDEHLNGMLAWSNLGLRKPWSYWRFYRILARRLARAMPRTTSKCLVDEDMWLESRSEASTLRVPGQVAFWLFVLKDAIALHVARTLALVAAHPGVQDKLREEIRAAGPLQPPTIDGLAYLEACILEQLRLWTPVPLLLRRATSPMSLGDDIDVTPGAQIAFFAGFHHRDARAFGVDTDRFRPEAALAREHRAFYAFSAHRQRCAGRTLVLFVLKATLASLLTRARFELVKPSIDVDPIPYRYDHFGIALRAVVDQ
jgi:cytochrome P450